MLLMIGNTRSGGVGQGRASLGRRAAVGAKRRALTDAGVEGIRPRMLKGFAFNRFPKRNFKVALQQPSRPVFPLAA
jgi:hypothetical protein